jgi:ribosome-binding factor A
MGTEHERKRALAGLKHATGFLQARMAARLQTRFTPVLGFKHDDSVKKSAETLRLIEEAIASDQKPGTAVAAAVEEAASNRSAGSQAAATVIPESS